MLCCSQVWYDQLYEDINGLVVSVNGIDESEAEQEIQKAGFSRVKYRFESSDEDGFAEDSDLVVLNPGHNISTKSRPLCIAGRLLRPRRARLR